MEKTIERKKDNTHLSLCYKFDGTHNFILFRGKTLIHSTAGAWTNYLPPKDGNPGVVLMLYATRESRIYAPILLGVLAKHSLETYGELPVGSHDLSCHSFPIQKRMAEILGQLPAESPVNMEDWFRSIDFLNDWASDIEKFEELPISRLAEGKDLLIQIVRDGRNGRYQPAFIDRESEFAAQRRVNGRRLDEVEKDFLESLS